MKRETYDSMCELAKSDNEGFWRAIATRLIDWMSPFQTVHRGTLGADAWFPDGELNACANCIDRWAATQPTRNALVFSDNSGASSAITYADALATVQSIAAWLLEAGLQKGDTVTLYLSMTPTAVLTMLACARIGVTHNVVFGGFSSCALRLRVEDSRSKAVITQLHAWRGDRRLDFFTTVTRAVADLGVPILLFDGATPCGLEKNVCDAAQPCSCAQPLSQPLIVRWSTHSLGPHTVVPVSLPAEHPLFYLYTSGSTGRPKGLIHTTGGYLVYAAYSLETAFATQPGDVFFCTADIGWITGHSYAVYGPLALGLTSVIMEGLPTYPTYNRLFELVAAHRVTHLYTAPTIVRILKAFFDTADAPPGGEARTWPALRALGTVGEPINREAYLFFSKAFEGRHVVDTYFQTETGGILVAPIPGVAPGVPECAAFPLPGIVISVADVDTAESVRGAVGAKAVLGDLSVVCSWPGITRGILNDPARFQKTYFLSGVYATGDEAMVDENGLVWIRGRADDVLNVSGHRISTAEVESAACTFPLVAEAAVIAVAHPIKGQSMVLFVVLKEVEKDYEHKICAIIANRIGGFCRPDKVIAVPGIPKTATGKLMRRVLRALMQQKDVGDLSTCVNKDVVDEIRILLH